MSDADTYEEFILPHARSRRLQGGLSSLPLQCVVRNPSCGDQVELAASVSRGGDIIDIRYHAKGCILNRAAASILCEYLQQKRLDDARHLSANGMLMLLRVVLLPRRRRCALLPWEALQLLIARFHREAAT